MNTIQWEYKTILLLLMVFLSCNTKKPEVKVINDPAYIIKHPDCVFVKKSGLSPMVTKGMPFNITFINRVKHPDISPDSALDGFWGYFRHQVPWLPGGGQFAGDILDHVPDDSVRKWIGKKAFDSLLNDYNKPIDRPIEVIPKDTDHLGEKVETKNKQS